MKILHVAHQKMYKLSIISGIKAVLEEQVLLEREIGESYILGDNESYENSKYLSGASEESSILEYKPDIVIFDGFWSLYHIKISKILLKNKIKYFIKPHGSFDKRSLKNSLIKMIKKKLGKLLIFDNFVKKASGIIYLNEEEENKSVYKKNNSYIQPNVFDRNNYKVEKKLDSEEGFKIIYIGRIDMFHKGLDILLETILKNKKILLEKKIFFEFYGSGLEKDVIKLKKYENKLKDLIKFYGVIRGNKKFEVLSKANIFIHTSRFEGQPMAILEALSLGKPCLVSEGTNMKNIIQLNKAGWILEENDRLIDVILKAKFDYEKEKNTFIKNSQKCSDSFLWRNLKKKYQDGYKKMLELENDF